MKIISFATLKGGTGKTMTAFSTAGILAEMNYKVLAIDVDPQANLTSNLGIDETVENFLSVKEILEDKNFDATKAIIKSPINDLPTLDIIPGTIMLTGTEMRLVSTPAREFIFKNYFNKNAHILSQYDYIIFDTNPSMSVINQNAFAISDFICLVNAVGRNSHKGTELFMALWEDISENLGTKSNIKGLLINQFDKRTNLSKDFLAFLKEDEDVHDILFDAIIPINVKLKESELENKPINIYDKKSSGYKAYRSFVEELINRI